MFRFGSLLLAALVAACASGATPTLQPTIAPTSQPTLQPTTPPTPDQTVAPSPSATAEPSFEVVENPDGTVWVMREPGLRFAMPGDDAVWIGVSPNFRSWDVSRLDPVTNLSYPVIEDLPGVLNPIHGMAVNGSLWLSSWDLGNVRQFDTKTGDELADLPVGKHPIEPVHAFGDIWTLNHDGASVSRIDTETGSVAATIALDDSAKPLWMAQGAERLWVVGANSSIYVIDPGSNTLERTIDTGIGCLLSVTYLAERVWARSCDTPEMVSVDPDTDDVTTSDRPFVAVQPYVAQNGWIWLPSVSDGDFIDHLVALDPKTLEQVSTFALAEPLLEASFSSGFDSMWIASKNGALRVPEEALPTD